MINALKCVFVGFFCLPLFGHCACVCGESVCGEYLSAARVAEGHSEWRQINELEKPTSLLL